MQVIAVDVVLGATCLLMLGWVVWTAWQARRRPFPRIDSLRAREEFDAVEERGPDPRPGETVRQYLTRTGRLNQDWRESVPSRYRLPEQKEEHDG